VEWEWACRAGSSGASYGPIARVAWHARNSRQKTHRVGLQLPNAFGAFGLHDMLGNVMEWCSDGYERYPIGEVIDPTGPQDASHRVIRGGAWYNEASAFCRPAARDHRAPGIRGNYMGFRVTLSPTGSEDRNGPL
jgi:formylglycine-generating enzyme